MTAAPRIDHYDWAGGREAMLRFGPDTGPIAVLTLPLFEEANRTRAFAVAILRALATRGVASVLPDMPGQGESLVPLETLSLEVIRSAHHDLIDGLRSENRHGYAIGIRSGAMFDANSNVSGRWHLSPQDGPDLLRALTRLRRAASTLSRHREDDGTPGSIDTDDANISVEIAGNLVAPALLGDLRGDRPRLDGPARSVRLTTDPAPADLKIEAAPLWRRSEPGNDPALADRLADDIAEWIARCEG